MHGYELKKRLSFLLGHFWSVSYGSLYPALKRLEKNAAIERAYSVKAKTRTRNVYRITKEGEELFLQLLTEDLSTNSLSDTENFDVRMAFFQYLEPEERLQLLELRRTLLAEQVESFKAYRSRQKDQDRYSVGLLKHKVSQTMSDIRWLDKLMAHEKDTIRKRDSGSTNTDVDLDRANGRTAII